MGDGGKKRFVVEPHSPNYLHPSKGPGMMITTVIFDGKNYDLWERVVKTALKSKNKLVFVEGKLIRLKDGNDEGFSEAQAWDMVNSMLCSWLFNVLNLKLRMNVAYSDTTKIMWDDLKKRYTIANTPKIH